MHRLLIAFMLAIYAPVAAAKCGAEMFVLSGTVLLQDKKPAVGALVGAAWKEDSLIGGPALARTDSEGHYSITIRFRTYSSSPGKSWYECNGKLKQVTISAYSDTHYSPSLVVPFGNESRVEASPLELFLDISTGVPDERG